MYVRSVCLFMTLNDYFQTRAKMTVHIGFLNLCTASTTDDDIYSDRTRNDHVYRILNLYTACTSILCKDIVPFLLLKIKQKA